MTKEKSIINFIFSWRKDFNYLQVDVGFQTLYRRESTDQFCWIGTAITKTTNKQKISILNQNFTITIDSTWRSWKYIISTKTWSRLSSWFNLKKEYFNNETVYTTHSKMSALTYRSRKQFSMFASLNANKIKLVYKQFALIHHIYTHGIWMFFAQLTLCDLELSGIKITSVFSGLMLKVITYKETKWNTKFYRRYDLKRQQIQPGYDTLFDIYKQNRIISRIVKS